MTDKRSAHNFTILYRMIIALFAGLFLTIESLAEEGVEVSTPSNFVLMSSGGSSSTNASSTDGHWNNWDPGNNVWYDSNGIPYYQTVATGEVFHGTNDLLGSPIWAPVAAAGTSDFYGTASANTSSNLLGGSREYYADNFNGDFEADASGLTTSYIDIHDSNFAAGKQANVTANNGTVMEMYNNNFNGNTTVTAASGGTVNVTLGNSSEMTALLDMFYLYSYNWSHMLYSSNSSYAPTVQNPYTGNTLSVPVFPFRLFYLGWDPVNHVFAMSQDLYYGNLLGFLQRTFMASYGQAIVSIGQYLNYQYNVARQFKIYTFTLSNNGETYSLVESNSNATFYQAIINRFDIIINLLNYHANRFYNWFYPLKPSSNYWKAYNTDTGEYDTVNPATVFAYITWYLGQLYNDSTNVTQNMQQMTQDIGSAATTFQDLNQKEQVAINQIQQGFESFLPDPTEFQSFRAITWCSNYLQQIYVALGAYGTVIFIALLFGVCLQFIGYFRYK